jgi:signal transduction histidine kinase
VRVFTELYRKTRELERLNAELEDRVRERTAELEESSTELRQLNEELEQRIDQRTREREEALAQLFEAQKLDTIGQLTGGVAHDFNNLLMAIMGSLNLLKKRMPPDDKNERLIGNALQAAERGAALTQRLLAFARRQELKPQAVNFPKLFENVEDLLKKAIGPGVDIRSEIPPDLPRLLVDANQLELALLNLSVNARDAMSEGGTILVSAEERCSATPQTLKPGRYVRLSVVDHGEGMDEETAARAAEPFFTTKGPGKGTGLGLSMVHGLAAQSGGVLELSSIRGKGTTVSLWLPVAQDLDMADSKESSPVEAAVPVSRPLKVLVVDDDPLVRLGTLAMLEDLGHIPVEASSAEVALEILARGEICDVVVTDHAMPGMTGADLARSISVLYKSMPVILASGYADLPDDPDLLNLLRMNKPFTQEQLQTAIQGVVINQETAA